MRLLRPFIISFVISLFALTTKAADLINFDVTPLSNKSVELILTFNKPIVQPQIKDDNQPPRVIIDLPKVKLKLAKNNYPLNFDNLANVLFLSVKKSTRMIINLERLESYQVGIKDTRLYAIMSVPDDSDSDFFINSDGDKISTIKTGAYVSNYGGKFKTRPITRIQNQQEPTESESDILWSTPQDNKTVPAKIGSLKKGKRIINKNKPDEGLPSTNRPATEEIPEWDVVFEGFESTPKTQDSTAQRQIQASNPTSSNPTQNSNTEQPFTENPEQNITTRTVEPSPDTRKPPATRFNELTVVDFDFNKGDQGEGIAKIQFSHEAIDVDIQRHHRHVTFQFHNAKLPEDLKLRFDVVDFDTVVTIIDIDTKGLDTFITIELNDEYDYFIYQMAGNYFIYLSNAAFQPPQVRSARGGVAYYGRDISINFDNIELTQALQQIANFVDLNLVISPSIQGTTSLNLTDIPWNHALDALLNINQLSSTWHNQSLLIAPTVELAKMKQHNSTEGTITELLPLYHSNAAQIENLIKASGLLSKRGKIVTDQRTNTLLIHDYPNHIDDIQQSITILDRPLDQVSIEARIVVANTSYRKQIGVNWNDAIEFDIEATYPNNQLALGILNNTELLDIQLTAMENEGQGEVISKPKVITANNQHASIRSGQEFAIFNRDNDGNNTNTTFKQALLALNVTPQITSNDNVLLNLSIAQDALSGFNDGIPIIDITNLDTTVSVGNGETIVLGGLYQTSNNRDIEKVPLLNRIPLLGKLFKRQLKTKQKQEVLVFITPTILPSNNVARITY